MAKRSSSHGFLIERNDLIERLRRSHLTVTVEDLNLFEYFGLVVPVLKTISQRSPEGAKTGIFIACPGDEEYEDMLMAPLATWPDGDAPLLDRWISCGNLYPDGEWAGDGMDRTWRGSRADDLQVKYADSELPRIAELTRVTAKRFNVLSFESEARARSALSQAFSRAHRDLAKGYRFSKRSIHDDRVVFQIYMEELVRAPEEKGTEGIGKRVATRLKKDSTKRISPALIVNSHGKPSSSALRALYVFSASIRAFHDHHVKSAVDRGIAAETAHEDAIKLLATKWRSREAIEAILRESR